MHGFLFAQIGAKPLMHKPPHISVEFVIHCFTIRELSATGEIITQTFKEKRQNH